MRDQLATAASDQNSRQQVVISTFVIKPTEDEVSRKFIALGPGLNCARIRSCVSMRTFI